MSSPAALGAAVRRVLWITLFLNLAVSAGKILVGTLSGSVSMVADGYHSLVDGSNNVIGLFVAAFAYAPPDPGHPYGHRKFETAATTLIGGALLALSYSVVQGALSQASGAHLPAIGALNWAVMIVTIAMNLFVSWYESREGRRLGSDYLVADATHTRSDLYVSLGVIASFAGAKAGLPWADAVVAIAIAVVIAVQAVKILAGSFHVLTDRAVVPVEAIVAVVQTVEGVSGCRDVRSRGGADAAYVDLVAFVDGGLTLRAAHDLADQIEAALKRAHPHIVDVVVHLEPF
ncbi:MAG: cation diffusion facilitator family transporter [Vicinamibacteria bacterium]